MTEIQENMLLYFLGNGIAPEEVVDDTYDMCNSRLADCYSCAFFKNLCYGTNNFITSEDLEKFLEKYPEYNIII